MSARKAWKGKKRWAQSAADMEDEEGDLECTVYKVSVTLAMWEMNQNDKKRDTGTKLYRLKLAKQIRIGQRFSGLVMSPDATKCISPADRCVRALKCFRCSETSTDSMMHRDIVAQHGLGVVNCSWVRHSVNRLL